MTIRSLIVPACFGLALAAVAPVPVAQAKSGGCLKYGAAGAVAGHVAGHHTVLGAAAGCAVGIWKRHHAEKRNGAADRAPAGSHM